MAKCTAKLKKLENNERVTCDLDEHTGYHQGVDSGSNTIKWLSMTNANGDCDIYMIPYPPEASG